MRWMAGASFALSLSAVAWTARADTPDAYQVVIIPGSPVFGQSIVRINTATGKGHVCFSMTCLPVSEPSPIGPSTYRLMRWETFDATLANHAWGAVRVDTKSGRTWSISTDTKTASWVEYTFP